MQLQFEKQGIPCLQTVKREIQRQEQTQELRVSDGMPDIGSIVGAWGQVILRTKEWQSDGMAVSGGTMVWVQYLPEGGGTPQCLESWLPFQMRWSFPHTKHDGKILSQCFLRSVDARSTSARKLILRTNVDVLGWAVENGNCDTFTPSEIPEDIQLLTRSYPMQLPSEAGEKAFSLEETLILPLSAPKVETLVSYCLQPEITEEKLMGDKVVFRGNALLHLVYLSEDGGTYEWDFDLPFTQYNELEGEYGEDAQVLLLPCVTSLELQREEEQLSVKAGIVCQYRISSRTVIQVVKDAYSNERRVEPVYGQLQLPGILERKDQTVHGKVNMPLEGLRMTDVQFRPLPVTVRTEGDLAKLELGGQFQVLYYTMDGEPCTATEPWTHTLTMPIGENVTVDAITLLIGKGQGSMLSGSAQLNCDVSLLTESIHHGSIQGVCGLEVGEERAPDPDRPSLILRRAEGNTLWELAKKCGSTEAAIREANQLRSEPERDQLLLIPVI